MTSPEIPITGYDANYRVPGVAAEILFAQGPASAAKEARQTCLVMPMNTSSNSASGNWTSATLYQIKSEKDAADGAGEGSPLHMAAKVALLANKNEKLWALPVAETSGGAPVKATWTGLFATVPTAYATFTITICNEDCVYACASGTALATIGAALVAAINAKTWLPVTASWDTATLTLTAKLYGASQGTATVRAIPVRSDVTKGVGTTITASGGYLGTGVAGVDGSTTEAANAATALAAIATTKKYYLVTSAQDATTLGSFDTHVTTKSEPRQGMRSQTIAAYVNALADGQTLATGKNYERLTIAWQKNSEWTPWQIAANLAAVMQKRQSVDGSYNFAGYSATDWLVPGAYLTSDWPTKDDQNDAINDGLTCIASKDGGGSYIVMLCNTRSKDSTGALDDFRACEGHRVSEADEFVDDLCSRMSLNHKGKKLRQDETLADGTVNTNQRRVRDVVTPSQLVPEVYSMIDEYYDAGKIQEPQASKDSLRVVKSPANAARVEAGLDLNVIDHLHQITFRIAETSTG